MTAQQPRAPINPNNAIVLEILPGLFGFLGIGWIYSGYTQTGVILLILWWLLVWGSWITILLGSTVFTTITFGLGFFSFCCLCIIPILQIGGSVLSGITLKNKLETQMASQAPSPPSPSVPAPTAPNLAAMPQQEAAESMPLDESSQTQLNASTSPEPESGESKTPDEPS